MILWSNLRPRDLRIAKSIGVDGSRIRASARNTRSSKKAPAETTGDFRRSPHQLGARSGNENLLAGESAGGNRRELGVSSVVRQRKRMTRARTPNAGSFFRVVGASPAGPKATFHFLTATSARRAQSGMKSGRVPRLV